MLFNPRPERTPDPFENKEIPDKLQDFMYGLIKEAQRNSFVDFCENWGIEMDTDYSEIERWFKKFGINL